MREHGLSNKLTYRRYLVPWDEDTPDARGFWRYARDHYARCIIKASDLANEFATRLHLSHEAVFQSVFEKLASPLVYLYDAWAVMSAEKKIAFDQELARLYAEAKKQGEEVLKK
jgi:hypothetical protein